MYRSMVGVGALCGLLLVTAFLVTRPAIERNRADALERAIFNVLPGARASTAFRLDENERFAAIDRAAPGDRLVFAGYDEQGRLVGLAVEAEGMGYQDVIRLLWGYSFADDAIVGVKVLESKETPGLGDRIETDPEFLANFDKLDVRLSDDAASLAHAIVPVKHGKKTSPWQVDGITGATVSSKAIADILNRSASWWVPRVRRERDAFRKEG
jgi:electron transport complex protein RnfG